MVVKKPLSIFSREAFIKKVKRGLAVVHKNRLNRTKMQSARIKVVMIIENFGHVFCKDRGSLVKIRGV